MIIFKYPLKLDKPKKLLMYKRAQILDAQLQNGFLMLWVAGDIEKEQTTRYVRVLESGIGYYAPGFGAHISTVLFRNEIEWHVFEWFYPKGKEPPCTDVDS